MMLSMQFRYPLQKIVDLKSNQKQQAEWILSKAVGKLLEEESSLERLTKDKQLLQEELNQQSLQSTTISSMMLTEQYIHHLNQQIVLKHNSVLNAQTVVQESKTVLQKKMQDEKVWKTTKDKAEWLFQAQFLKKEQEELDEIATVRFVNSIS